MKNKSHIAIDKNNIPHALIPINRQNKYFIKLLLLGLIAVSGYLFFNRPVHLPLQQAIFALCIIWCGFAPAVYYFYDENKPPFPFIPLIGYFYAIWFGLSAFNDEISILGGQSHLSLKAFALILSGMTVFFISFYLSSSNLWKKIVPLKLPNHFPLNSLRVLLWCFLLINISPLITPIAYKIPSISHLIRPFGYIAFGGILILWLRRNISILEFAIVFLILAPLEMVYLISTGSLAPVFFFILFLLFVYWFHSKRVPIFFIASIAAAIIIFNPVKNEYRNLTWGGGLYQHLNFVDKASLFFRLVVNHHLKKDGFESRIKLTKKDLNRFNHISIFSHITYLTPETIPFWQGETYKGVFIKFIPRVFWPDKPSYPTGNIFGQRYGIISSVDTETSINLQWTIEMYINFGIPGVIIGMGLLGILLSFVEKKLNHPDMSYLEFMVGLAILLPMSRPESALIDMLGLLIFLPITLYIIINIMLRLEVR